jgi:hypothetical protein
MDGLFSSPNDLAEDWARQGDMRFLENGRE